MITNVPGASAVFHGSIVAYDNKVKIRALDVKPKTIQRFGAVSEEVAREMAEGALVRLGTDFALAVTGIAGPEAEQQKNLSERYGSLLPNVRRRRLREKIQGDFGRKINRERAASAALEMLRRRLVA